MTKTFEELKKAREEFRTRLKAEGFEGRKGPLRIAVYTKIINGDRHVWSLYGTFAELRINGGTAPTQRESFE